MKKAFISLALVLMCTLLAGCCISHQWQEATCTAPRTCAKCGETEGEALAHSWAEATCTAPKTCTVCAAAEGEALLHSWAEATCTSPKTCTVCASTEGEALAHEWQEATLHTPKTCAVCSATEGTATNYFAVNGIEYQEQLPESLEATAINFNISNESNQLVFPAYYRDFQTQVAKENSDGSKIVRLFFQAEFEYRSGGSLGQCSCIIDYNFFDLYTGQMVPIEGSVTCRTETQDYVVSISGTSGFESSNVHTTEDGATSKTLLFHFYFEINVPAGYDGLVLAVASPKHYGLTDTKWQNLLAEGMMASDFAVYTDYYEDVQFFRIPIA